jgi:hypothetical protein
MAPKYGTVVLHPSCFFVLRPAAKIICEDDLCHGAGRTHCACASRPAGEPAWWADEPLCPTNRKREVKAAERPDRLVDHIYRRCPSPPAGPVKTIQFIICSSPIGSVDNGEKIIYFFCPTLGSGQYQALSQVCCCCLLLVKISRFKELRLFKVSNASSVSLGLTRVSLGSTRAIG